MFEVSEPMPGPDQWHPVTGNRVSDSCAVGRPAKADLLVGGHRRRRAGFGRSYTGPVGNFVIRFRGDRGKKPESLARHGLDDTLLLAAIADRLSRRADAGRDRGIGHDAAIPDRGDELVVTDNPGAMLGQVNEQIEYLGLDIDFLAAARQYPGFGIDDAIVKLKFHRLNSVLTGDRQPGISSKKTRSAIKRQEFHKTSIKCVDVPAGNLGDSPDRRSGAFQ